MNLRPALAPILLASLLIGCGDRVREEEEGRFALPRALTEVSGLAKASGNSVFAHNDEQAVIHELRISDGEKLRSFQLGAFGVAGDFEGVAVAGGRIYLVTSDGRIYDAAIGEHREQVDYSVYDSGLGKRCEIEGLSRAPTAGYLLVLCKEMKRKKDRGRLEIHRWKIGSERAEEEPFLSIPLDELLGGGKTGKFRPSALEWDPEERQIWIASARSRELLVLGPTGTLLEWRKLDRERHPQVEGLTLLPGRQLVLADERADARSAYLTVYTGLPLRD